MSTCVSVHSTNGKLNGKHFGMKNIILSAICLSSVAACSGGDSVSIDLTRDTNDVAVDTVEATGADSLNSAAPFPIRYSLISQPNGQPVVEVGRGLIEVIDAETIELTRQEGETPTRFTSVSAGSSEYTGTVDGNTVTLTLAEGSGTILAYLEGDVADNDFGFAGVYGFETPVDDLPSGSVVYNSGGLATAFIAVEADDPENLQIIQEAATNPSLAVDFGNNLVTGDLFIGTGTVDLDDDMAEDTLNLTVSIANGTINDGVIGGDISLMADVDLAVGGPSVDLNPTVSSSMVDATVYGITGNVVGGTFEGKGTFNDGSGALNYGIGGTFFTVGSP